jgi:hypothetical protein
MSSSRSPDGRRAGIDDVVVEGQVSVAGHPEDTGGTDIHTGEELVDECDQNLFERDKALTPTEGKEPRHVGRHFDTGETGSVVFSAADFDTNIER